MKTEFYKIGPVPAVLYGETSEQGYLFVHGQGGSKEEAAVFAQIAVPGGYQVLGVDLPQHGERKTMTDGFDPRTAVPELQTVLAERKSHWKRICVRANSIGAYFSILAFQHEQIDNALFVSPIVDMQRLIADMMGWAGVTEELLRDKGRIPTDFGQTLSWSYLSWVRQHPVTAWKAPTAILYAGNDNLTSRRTVTEFSEKHNAKLTVYEQGEHWFHTPEQCARLAQWERQNLS